MVLSIPSIKSIVLYSLLTVCIVPFSIYGEGLTDEHDCPIIVPEFPNSDDTALLTREERIELMDQAFEEALNKSRACRTPETQVNTSNPQDSAPSEQLSGTEPEQRNNQNPPAAAQPSAPAPDIQDLELETSAEGESGEQTSAAPIQEQTVSNGKLPEDIPPANNDDIVAQQIREAAINEQDSQKQAKLWNEYRRYKGLPER